MHTRSVLSSSLQPMNCSPPGSSVHGILQARILEWVAISFSRAFSHPGIKPTSLASSALAGRFFTSWAMGEALMDLIYCFLKIICLETLYIINVLSNSIFYHFWVLKVFFFFFLMPGSFVCSIWGFFKKRLHFTLNSKCAWRSNHTMCKARCLFKVTLQKNDHSRSDVFCK